MHADADFLNRRYFSNPYRSYVALQAIKNRKIVGYAVAEKKDCNVHIADCSVDLRYPQVVVFLLRGCLEYFDRPKGGKVIFCLSHKQYLEIAVKCGFLYRQKRECLFFKRMAFAFSGLKAEEFALLDSDLYHFNGFTQSSP
jgi:hypothetical protein